ncbi:MAG: hypothetical protein JWP91_2899 [Fibrobacteres bacterium]|nr:hypothetical protein [Fibrobacterota bacterium]
MKRIARIAALVLWSLPVLLAAIALTVPGATRADAAKAPEPDHAPWQGFLSRYLDTTASDGVNRVRYSAVTPADKAALKGYLRYLQSQKAVAMDGKVRRAFWIDLYNARTVDAILDAYPIKSIRDIKAPGAASAGPWDAKTMKVDGVPLSLNDIENNILRAQWKDGRIHFALNCASIGCPNLSPRAFTAATLEAQLEKGARDFLRSPRAAAFEGGTLRLSSLFDWYKGDFGKTDKEVLESISRFATPETAERLRAYAGKIEYRYDWNLNGI